MKTLRSTSLLLLVFNFMLQLNLTAQYTGTAPYCYERGGVIINEVSNGPSGFGNFQEYIELVVVGDPNNPIAPVDLSGLIIDDNNINMPSQGTATGHIVLGACYNAVSPGSIIVLFNGEQPNGTLPPADPMDANNDGVYVVPHNDAMCIDACNSNPNSNQDNSESALYCPCGDFIDIPVTWFFNLRNTGDVVQVRDKCETLIQAFSWGGVELTNEVSNAPVYFDLGGDAQTNRVVRLVNTVSDDWNNIANYDNPEVDGGTESPGLPNSPENADLIARIAAGTFDCTGLIWDCEDTDAGDIIIPDGDSTPLALCEGEDLNAFGSDYTQPDEFEPDAVGFTFEYAFILTLNNAPEYSIIDYNQSGDFDFSVLPVGEYTVWGFSYIQTNGSITVAQFLEDVVTSIEEIRAYNGCGFDGNLENLDLDGNEVIVSIAKVPVAIDPNDLTVCSDMSGQGTFDLTSLDEIVNGGSSETVLWTFDAEATNPIPDPAVFTSDDRSVFATVDNGSCISESVEVQVGLFEQPSVLLNVAQAINCNGDNSGQILVEITGGEAPYDIDWDPDERDGQSNALGLSAGTYSVTVTDLNGCTDMASVTLNEPEELALSCTETAPVSIFGNNDGTASIDITGGTAPYTVDWDGPLMGTQTLNAAGILNLTDLFAGIYQITLTDANGCEANCNLVINQPPCETVVTLEDTPIACQGEQNGALTAAATNGLAPYTFVWSTGDSTATISNLGPGSYTVEVSDAGGCTVSESFDLLDPGEINFIANSLPPVCFGDSNAVIQINELLGGTAPYSFFVDDDFVQTVDASSALISGLKSGRYDLRVEDLNGCTMSQEVIIDEPEELILDLGSDETLILGDTFIINGLASFTVDTVFWEPALFVEAGNKLQTTAFPIVTTTFTARAFDDNGCFAVDEITLFVDTERNVFIPNVFSPDGNGLNDVFFIFGGSDVIQVESFLVFDRWGNQVFEKEGFQANDQNFGWDGNFRGEEMNSGVYVYTAEILFQDGAIEVFKGSVVLLRD